MSDVTIDMVNNHMQVHHKKAEDWKVTLVDTGEDSMTGGRLKRVWDYVKDEQVFFLTYGDGLSDIDIAATLAFHQKHGKLATVTAVQQPVRYGVLSLQGVQVTGFAEKPAGNEVLINGGFFVMEPEVFDYIDGDDTTWEKEPMQRLANEGKLCAFIHEGFWQNMDTLRDKMLLEELWRGGDAPWAIWNQNISKIKSEDRSPLSLVI